MKIGLGLNLIRKAIVKRREKLDKYKTKKIAKALDMDIEDFKRLIKRTNITKEEAEKMVAGTK